MLRSCLAGCATALLLACQTPRAISREIRDEGQARVHIAKLEAARDHGQVELAGIVRDGEESSSLLALRALGRIDTSESGRALVAYAGGVDGATAATAIGLATALDEPGIETTTLRTDALLSAFRTDTAHHPVILEAIGRAADLRALPVLATAVTTGDPASSEAACIALGRFGRRKLALDSAAHGALVFGTRSTDRKIRYAATYALRQETIPAGAAPDSLVASALAARVADDDAETRAQAIIALAKRDAIISARPAIEQALRDRDWRVAVEAARALGGEHGGEAGHAAVIAAVPRWVAAIPEDPPAAQVALEALTTLALATPPPATLVPMLHALVVPPGAPPIVRGWLACDVVSARARLGDATLADVASCGNGELPDHLRLPLVAELIGASIGDVQARRTALAALLAHADVRVRASALAAFTGIWKDGSADDHHAAIATLVAALGATDAVMVGSAVDAIPALAKIASAEDLVELDAAIVARAAREVDVEISASLLELVGTRKLAAGVSACRGALTGHVVRRKAAEGCLRELGEAVPPALADPPKTPIPPVDITTVIGHAVRWHLVTTRGEIVIALRPDVAPWAVATIVDLTRKGFYDKHELHRVVPDFVAQGGDPTETGQGGPGYTLPAEPASSDDGPGFVTGGVGIADAGPDSGGSQWFIMHSRAPHLDGRYTWVGNVESGQKSADSLVIGDSVIHATVDITEAPATEAKPSP